MDNMDLQEAYSYVDELHKYYYSLLPYPDDFTSAKVSGDLHGASVEGAKSIIRAYRMGIQMTILEHNSDYEVLYGRGNTILVSRYWIDKLKEDTLPIEEKPDFKLFDLIRFQIMLQNIARGAITITESGNDLYMLHTCCRGLIVCFYINKLCVDVLNTISANINLGRSSSLRPLSFDEEGNLSPESIEDMQDYVTGFHICNIKGDIKYRENVSRFSSATWFNKICYTEVLLAGLGGIGSYVAFLLSRLNIKELDLYDPDTVEGVNLSGQLYGVSDIGSTKASAMAKFIINYSNFYRCNAYPSKYTEQSPAKDIMICGFDNMSARRIFFNNWKTHVLNKSPEEQENCLLIDGRLAAEEFQVFAIQGNDTEAMDKYNEEWLFTSNKAEQTQCSYKQTSYMANMIASIMVNILINFITNKCNPLIERDVPFMTTYMGEQMYFKTERL